MVTHRILAQADALTMAKPLPELFRSTMLAPTWTHCAKAIGVTNMCGGYTGEWDDTMLSTLEYRRVARSVMKDMGLRSRGTWTDDPRGFGWTRATEPKRTVTIQVLDRSNLFGDWVLPEFFNSLRTRLKNTYPYGEATVNSLRVTQGGYIKCECIKNR